MGWVVSEWFNGRERVSNTLCLVTGVRHAFTFVSSFHPPLSRLTTNCLVQLSFTLPLLILHNCVHCDSYHLIAFIWVPAYILRFPLYWLLFHCEFVTFSHHLLLTITFCSSLQIVWSMVRLFWVFLLTFNLFQVLVSSIPIRWCLHFRLWMRWKITHQFELSMRTFVLTVCSIPWQKLSISDVSRGTIFVFRKNWVIWDLKGFETE